jgi:Pycsar effector protein
MIKNSKTHPEINPKKGKLDKYDARGIQTLFRTLSRNHYNLLKMVDNKARIVLTVNSIITSLLLGVLFLSAKTQEIKIELGTRILLICSMLSMAFALFSMLPHRYLSNAFKKSGYKGTLYAENFSSLSLEEFKSEFKRIMEKGQAIYDEMIIDLYFLGKIISQKQKLLLFSVVIFLMGLVTAIAYSLVNGLIAFS